MAWTKPFSQISKGDAAIAGGKGASLGEMTQAGISVPPGFVLLSAAFEHFLEATDLNIEIDAILKTVDQETMHTVENASEKIQALILSKEIPPDIRKEIVSGFDDLGAEFVAVRSSATAEDSASAAWAGQLDTFLNTTEVTLLENVRRCWASLFTPRAIFYRFEKGLHAEKVSVAVVIQKMVNSECAGIAFSVHPVTEDRNQMIIEAAFGLGEAVVSGQITPDSYVVTKQPLVILDKNLVEQERALYRKKGGGNEWVNLSPEKGKEQEISDKQILELAALIIKIENHYGFPVDVEWAVEGGAFFITQSRPITTLQGNESKKEIILVWTRDYTLAWAEWWIRDLNPRLEEVIGVGVPNQFSHFNGILLETYRPLEEAQAFIDAVVNINPQSGFFDQEKIDHYKSTIVELRKFLNRVEQTGEFSDIAIFKEVKRLSREMYPWYTVSFLLPQEQYVHKLVEKSPENAKVVLPRLIEARKASEGTIAELVKYWRAVAKKELVSRNLSPQYSSFVTFGEIERMLQSPSYVPPKEELEKRTGGYVFHLGQVFTGLSLTAFLGTQDYYVPIFNENTSGELKGSVACPGPSIIRGSVQKIFRDDEITSFKEGNILVTVMTNPFFVPALKKALAVITDEGGITCHAAIASRELNIPCIIGTKIATKVLKDGDMVEVDAEKGVVRILAK